MESAQGPMAKPFAYIQACVLPIFISSKEACGGDQG